MSRREEGGGQRGPRLAIRRLWEKDSSLFSPDPAAHDTVVNRLGWLDAPRITAARAGEIEQFAVEAAGAGFRTAVILGMGGSSLCPLVLSRVFTPRPDRLSLEVADTTSPGTVADLLGRLDPASTLFVVSSKSGTTIEPDSLYRIVRQEVSQRVKAPGGCFAAITDPGTPLERLAREEGFRKVFLAPPDVGGRYSALTVFGMVPAALMGLDIRRLLAGAESMAALCRIEGGGEANPGFALGSWMAHRTLAGRDKLTLAASPTLAPLALWLEQLVAESTGKDGRGILPVAGEEWGDAGGYGTDRAVVRLALRGDGENQRDNEALRRAGVPVYEVFVESRLDLGAEFFRWETATAVASALLGMNPFDEPNVAESKANTQTILREHSLSRTFPSSAPEYRVGDLVLYLPRELAFPRGVRGAPGAKRVFEAFLSMARKGDYLAILAYLPYDPGTEALMGRIRSAVTSGRRMATTFGYGPRYLHSTGQIHKGGAASGLFLLFTETETVRLPVPGAAYTLGELHTAQALGDERALRGRGRPMLRIHLEKGAGDLQGCVDAILEGR